MSLSAERTPRVAVTDGVSVDLDLERDVLAAAGAEIVVAKATSEQDLLGLIGERTDALLVCYAQIGPAVVEAAAAAGCRIIARTGIGVDNIDLAAAARCAVPVTNVPDYCIEEVADHTLALMLAVMRGVIAGSDEVRAGGWARPGALQRLRGRRLALLGMGRIGRCLCERVRPLGLEIAAHDPFADTWPDGVEREGSAHAAVADADVVSLHVPLTAETHHLVDADLIGAMRRNPVLINTARGALVDTDAVLEALDDGRIGAVALDVTEPEPLPRDHPLRDHPRAIITPHMAFFSEQAEADLRRRAAGEILRALRGEPLNDPVASAPNPATQTT